MKRYRVTTIYVNSFNPSSMANNCEYTSLRTIDEMHGIIENSYSWVSRINGKDTSLMSIEEIKLYITLLKE